MVRLTRVCVVLGSIVLVLGGGYWLSGQEEKTPQPAVKAVPQSDARKDQAKEPALAKFMRAKLNASSQILEGLCTEDYESIQAGAEKLKSMSNEERWRVSNDAMYRQQSAEFRDAVENILTAAKEKKNLDSAALAWTKTTLSCIECHRWVRNTLLTEKDKE
jgi:cytochrome c556